MAQKIFIHKYKYSHDTRRKQTKGLLKNGVLEVLEVNRTGTLYKCLQPIRVSNRGRLIKRETTTLPH